MSMTPQEQQDLRNYCASLLKDYGFHFSPEDPVIPALYVIHKETESNLKAQRMLTTEFRDALDKVKPQFHFHDGESAWKFQLSGLIKWAISVVAVLVAMGTGVWQWSRVHDVDAARQILDYSPRVNALLKCVKRTDAGLLFLDFTVQQGDSIAPFLEYERINKKTVRVYLGMDSTEMIKR
ncbi:hypothetical protein [Pseudochryseolinea flava]|uniref:Uncharacterized protein n=1 Tax=Pseudochryseolinea flava TaxID=2059302 RepID=A0A364Y2K1_9BACT|nr:hypothetical protein [Pseudochryseolinea flava]RAW01095.1 hypothetical protein DQQ10_12770 [Pseudochryseolinea flava]